MIIRPYRLELPGLQRAELMCIVDEIAVRHRRTLAMTGFPIKEFSQ
jgi:hypothetical protein